MKLDHHIRTYIFFLLLSILLVSILVYLYMPAPRHLQSDVLVISSETVIDPPYISQEVSQDAVAARRRRLTSMLLKYQAQLREMETIGAQDEAKIQEVSQIRTKIENLESLIKKLSE